MLAQRNVMNFRNVILLTEAFAAISLRYYFALFMQHFNVPVNTISVSLVNIELFLFLVIVYLIFTWIGLYCFCILKANQQISCQNCF